ncbi:E3 ubiquitin-protein ligase TRIM9 (RING finger protein 91) (RING-type E3 ubiquitin transferase TRIM9) (Tripartite motif-containing protein 9) [Durusdinium trenchii]|uniref:E3 ubiquitin-protein ligase TRIM9 (RING finger protein 91) (RING-type E3 ubiquitin transferase TRIM9) (Tripartite motif-containing protein 9) n=1 Tax=Durusdinium trenchii TaxID=1381693 RepID=A0ABP0JF89_9DINO
MTKRLGPSGLVRSQASALVAKARGADSLDAVADWQQVYRVVFEEQRAAAKPLICEYCEQRPAAVYCKNDNAHFCAACDTTHHSENEFFARHQRFSLEHSPLQFGFCRQHPSERHESVCLQCKTMLCRMCNKFGDHARKEHEGHTLMSTVEAFQLAMQQSTDSDSQQEKHQTLLRDALQDRHFQMMEVHNNFQETQHQMDVVLRGALDQLERAQSRKLEFLQSMKRQVTTQLLFIQWLDNFQSHARMALPPAEPWSCLSCDRWVMHGLGDRAQENPVVESVNRFLGVATGRLCFLYIALLDAELGRWDRITMPCLNMTCHLTIIIHCDWY